VFEGVVLGRSGVNNDWKTVPGLKRTLLGPIPRDLSEFIGCERGNEHIMALWNLCNRIGRMSDGSCGEFNECT
jgi:hypothetical protein